MDQDDFRDGFLFALHVIGSMGHRPKFDDLIGQLVSVARSELSLQPTPEEVIRGIEAEVGRPMPEELKASVFRIQSGRSRSDDTNREFARRMLAAMGVDPDRPPPAGRG